jgi:serine/threonine protein phosphatase PrpC
MEILSYGMTLTGSSGINGDSFYISPDNKVFILSDGASGSGKQGKVLMSGTCVEIAKQNEFLYSNLEPKDYVDSLFWKMNNELIRLSQESRKRCYGTIIIAVIENNTLTITTLGDSPAFLYSGGAIKQVAKYIKRYSDMVEQGYITQDEYDGYIKQMHERMATCFDYFLPEIIPTNVIEQYTIKPGDMIVMCCDGLSDHLTPDRMFDAIIKYGIYDGVNNLISQAKEIALSKTKYYDDITAIAVQFQ